MCPENSNIFKTNFKSYETVNLDPTGAKEKEPVWMVLNEGREITQLVNSDPGLAVGGDSFSDVDFEGTFFVNDKNDDDFIGLVFSYQSNRKFYSVMWKQTDQVYWGTGPLTAYARKGISIKLINSTTGPGKILKKSLWNTDSTAGEVTKLWHKNVGWEFNTSYRWKLLHRPRIGLIHLTIYQGATQIVYSDNVYDSTLKGGQLGVYCFSQEKVVWSNLIYRCNSKVPLDIYEKLSEEQKKKLKQDDEA